MAEGHAAIVADLEVLDLHDQGRGRRTADARVRADVVIDVDLRRPVLHLLPALAGTALLGGVLDGTDGEDADDGPVREHLQPLAGVVAREQVGDGPIGHGSLSR